MIESMLNQVVHSSDLRTHIASEANKHYTTYLEAYLNSDKLFSIA
jgi:hypothetical protein